jgi:hypothetical protein
MRERKGWYGWLDRAAEIHRREQIAASLRFPFEREIDLGGVVLISWALIVLFVVIVGEAGIFIFRGYLWLRYASWPLFSVNDLLQSPLLVSHSRYNAYYSLLRASFYHSAGIRATIDAFLACDISVGVAIAGLFLICLIGFVGEVLLWLEDRLNTRRQQRQTDS